MIVMVITEANRVGVRLVAAAVLLLVLPSTGLACVEKVAELPDGPARAVDLEGDLAVFSSGRVLIVADLSVPSEPVELGRVVLAGVIQDVDLVGDRAYAAIGEYGLAVVELGDPGGPILRGHVAAGVGETIDVAVVEPHAFTVELEHVTEDGSIAHFNVIDVSDPSNPNPVVAVETDVVLASQLAVSGHVVYMASGAPGWPVGPGRSGLLAFDVSDPEQPIQLASPNPALQGVVGFAVSGGLLFVHGVENWWEGTVFEVFDLTDPASPARLARLEGSFVPFGDLSVSDGLAVVTTLWGLTTIDVSDPEHPTFIGSLDKPGRGLQVSTNGSIAAVTADAGGLRLIDVADAAEPALIGVLDTPGSSDFISIVGDLAVISAEWWFTLDVGDGRLIDVSNPARPAELGALPVAPERGPVAIDGMRAYVMTGVHEDREVGLSIIDITDPSASVEVGFVATDLHGHDVAVRWPYAYLAGYGGMKIVDVGSPSEPEVVASIELERSLYSVAVDGDHAFVGRFVDDYPYTQTFQTLDIADPLHPVELGDLEAGPYWTLTIRDGLVYGGADHGLVVADVHEPSSPEFVFSTMMESSSGSRRYSASLGEQIAAVSRVRTSHDRDPDALDRVAVFDLEDPRRPMRSAVFDVPFPVKDVGAVGDFVYVAQGDAGVSVYDVSACEPVASRRSTGRVTP